MPETDLPLAVARIVETDLPLAVARIVTHVRFPVQANGGYRTGEFPKGTVGVGVYRVRV
jgi:hypothetical protein